MDGQGFVGAELGTEKDGIWEEVEGWTSAELLEIPSDLSFFPGEMGGDGRKFFGGRDWSLGEGIGELREGGVGFGFSHWFWKLELTCLGDETTLMK